MSEHNGTSVNPDQPWTWPIGWRPGPVSCNTVARLLKAKHCTSCHYDMDEGYDGCEIHTRKGCIAVCCTVAMAWGNR
jgi:hypothetical protein